GSLIDLCRVDDESSFRVTRIDCDPDHLLCTGIGRRGNERRGLGSHADEDLVAGPDIKHVGIAGGTEGDRTVFVDLYVRSELFDCVALILGFIDRTLMSQPSIVDPAPAADD